MAARPTSDYRPDPLTNRWRRSQRTRWVEADDAGTRRPGAYVLRRTSAPALAICAMGATIPEAVEASTRLGELGVNADVVCLTSPDLLFARCALGADSPTTRPGSSTRSSRRARAAPMVTVLDGHPHALAFLANIHRVPATHLGVSEFGQSGDLASVYRHHGIDADAVIAAALDLVD